MKKLLLVFAFLGLFTFLTPSVANAAEPCIDVVLVCPDGTQHIVVICDYEDLQAWSELLCGVIID